MPALDWSSTAALLPAAFVIALVSFMEVISTCKTIEVKTRVPWDEHQELIGQGLAKIAAAFTQAIPVSGSLSRSALNLAAGARTGLSSLCTALFVLLTLLFLTPMLYYVPLSVLGAIVIVALANLVDFASIARAWRATIDDGIAASVTFVATLIFAPNIQIGILTGILLSLALLLHRLMRPRVAILGLHGDGTLRDARRWSLPELHPRMSAMRFDGSLIFVNVSYFENAILDIEREYPRVKYILVAAGGINTIDASGIEMLKSLVARLKLTGITLTFSGIKQQVFMIMENTGLCDLIGTENIFATDRIALQALLERLSTPDPG
jgi:SulP family sulfate permease